MTPGRRLRACAAGLGLAAVVISAVSCSSGGPAEAVSSAPTTGQMSTLLSAHAHAVLAHDRAAYLDGVASGPESATFRTQQGSAYRDLAELPLASWQYRLGIRTDDPDAEKAATKKYGAAARIMQVTIRYALRGYDAQPTSRQVYWTFVRQHGKVVIAGDDDLAAYGGISARGPWDFGPLSIVRGARSLVLGHPGQTQLSAIAGLVDAAVPAVTAVWGSDWPQRVVVLVPAGTAELSADAGPAATITADVPAVTVSDGTDELSRAQIGLRLIVNPKALAGLTALGKQIVLRHEITHIATGSVTTDSSPRWLVEGFADYVGQLDDGQPVGVAAAELRTALRSGEQLTELPTDTTFDTQATAAQAYEQSWLACRLIAKDAGQAGLVRFYRLVGQAIDPDTSVQAALNTVLGQSVAEFTAHWRAYVRAELG